MYLRFVTLTCFCVLFLATAALAQAEMGARTITSAEFQTQRPSSQNRNSAVGVGSISVKTATGKSQAILTNPKRKYSFVSRSRPVAQRPAINPTAPALVAPTSEITPIRIEELGVTFWRLRPPTETEIDVPTFPVKIGARAVNWTAERVASTTKFKPGDRVRFTVESSRNGHLYIVDREIYADGGNGDAEIIFPTLRTRAGDNRVTAGSLIEIPASTDSVPYFTVASKRADYAGEELIVFILPNELTDFEKTLRAQPVDGARLEKWTKDWGTSADIYDAEDGNGIALTKAEVEASNTASRSLTREEPLPQTIYRVSVPKDVPLFVTIRMQTTTAKP